MSTRKRTSRRTTTAASDAPGRYDSASATHDGYTSRKAETEQQQSNDVLRERAHRRLDEIVDDAERRREFGEFGIEIQFENGRIKLIRRTFRGTDMAKALDASR